MGNKQSQTSSEHYVSECVFFFHLHWDYLVFVLSSLLILEVQQIAPA